MAGDGSPNWASRCGENVAPIIFQKPSIIILYASLLGGRYRIANNAFHEDEAFRWDIDGL